MSGSEKLRKRKTERDALINLEGKVQELEKRYLPYKIMRLTISMLVNIIYGSKELFVN